nr:hypothetical protein [uncultured Agathobaculum sp.]
MITILNRECVLQTNVQQGFFKAQQALSHAGIRFRTEVRDNASRLGQRQDVMGIRVQYPHEYRVYVHKQDAELARTVLKYQDNR